MKVEERLLRVLKSVKKNIKHENYEDFLFSSKIMLQSMKTIRHQKHQLGSYEINEVSLHCFVKRKSY